MLQRISLPALESQQTMLAAFCNHGWNGQLCGNAHTSPQSCTLLVNPDTGIRYLVQWKGYGPAYNSWEPERTLKRNAPETLSDYRDELEAAVQAAELEKGSDTGLAPSDQNLTCPAFTGKRRGRGRDRGRTGRSRGQGLTRVSKSLKK